MSTLLTFEHPLNERIRIFLRLEHLFARVDHFATQAQEDLWATRVLIESLIDIAAVTARSDIRSELQKELERNLATMQRIAMRPGIDPTALERVCADLDEAITNIQGARAPIGQRVRENEFLKSIAQRTSIPGGTCSFDVPQYHFWLTQPVELRQHQITDWFEDILPGARAIRLLLSLARNSAAPQQMLAENGFHQESFEAHAPPQMVRIQIQPDQDLYPEISGHKNRFSVRFMTIEANGRPSHVTEDTPFLLTCCAL